MQLQTYISNLLYRYECVTIPQFGAFITQSISAKIDSKNNTFYPPKKVIAFNAQLINNDGVLARYIADTESISFESATAKIAENVTHFKNKLDIGETLTFKDIGELTFNGERKIEFNPSYELNYLTDSFGLTKFIPPFIAREAPKVVTKKKAELQPISKPKLKKNTPKTKENTFRRSLYKYAAAAVVILSLTGFIGNNYVSAIESHNELAHQKANKELEAKIQEATFIINNPLPAITLTINKRKGKFHVIVGAHREKENALNEIKKLRNQGKDAWIENSKKGYYNIVYSSFKKHYKALEVLENVREVYNEDAWLYVKDLD